MKLPFIFRSLLWLMAAGWLTPGSSLAQQPSQTRSRPTNVPAAVVSAPVSALPANYVLSANDLVEVKVFQEDDMDWTVRVTKDGTVSIPVVGVISVKGKTPDQLSAVVRDRLHDGYLVHPQVNVSVLEFSKRRFTILGQVERPGQLDFPDNASVNVLQAIGMAGGTTKNADPGHVFVKRRVGAQEIVLKMDARRMAKDPSLPPFDILPGDTITVPTTIF